MTRRAAFVLALAVVGCGDDALNFQQSSTSPAYLPNAAEVMADGTLPANLCDIVPQVENAGLFCENAEFCGAGGLCIQPIGGQQGVCSQVCFPAPPSDATYPEGFDATFAGCGADCADGSVCATVIAADGAPVLLDLDLDGTSDVVAGACQRDAVGSVQAWGACGDAGVCAAGLACIELDGRTTGTCLPECTDTCDSVEGLTARCAATSTQEHVCLIACDPNDAATCPAGLTCAETARHAFTCVR
ncbi:MAG: hypothetical protein H6698_02105 [Myxococcales bacterium]|nr:hypothetical protein [Myxococcales bacterium]MCB9533105.1 hypothetical protein [Myxococcales bacterium]